MHAIAAAIAGKARFSWVGLACAGVLVIAPLGVAAQSAAAAAEHDAPVAKKTRKVKPLVEAAEPIGTKEAAKETAKEAEKPAAAEAAKLRKDPKEKPESQADAKEPAGAPGRRRAKEIKGAPDPMDVLRERLSARLGAAPVRDGQALRVAVHSPLPTPAKAVAAHGAAKAVTSKTRAAHGAAHWAYQGEGGPQNWGRLKPEFIKCSGGERQSPIDIRDGMKLQLDPVQFEYRPSGFRIIDNGHTVQVNVAGGNAIEVMGRRYSLVQFHFHRPSEERIEGRQFEMVVHLVHKDLEGRLAVVAVLLDQGSAHPLVQTVWNNLPLEKHEEVAAKAVLDLNALLPAERNYFTYMGSLTTPPCSEGVLWLVMKQPVQVSNEQIGIFSRLYPMNARPVQAASGRLIKESN